MKEFKIEFKYGDEATPDNNIWDDFEEPVEAEDAEEAVDLAMDHYTECAISDGEDVTEWERESDCISWIDEDGVKHWVIFCATECED